MKEINSKFMLLGNAILPFVETGKTYCIGLSGGSDSVLLLHSLHKLSLENNFRIVALHLNHSLRDDESECDAVFCEEICEKLGIELNIKKIDIKSFASENKFSIEEAARKYRYKWFAEVCEKINADSIFIAHHADDQSETVLLRLFRGAGLKGLAGMKKTTFFGTLKIVRPWLNIPRDILDNVIKEMKLQYRYDSSNSNIHFDRNWIRHYLIPKLNHHFKSNINDRLLRTAAISSEAHDFILQQAEMVFCKHARKSLFGNIFPLNEFKQLHSAVQNEVLILMFGNDAAAMQFSHKGIMELRNFTLSNSLHCPRQFPGTISVGKAYNHLYVGLRKNLKIAGSKIRIGESFTTKSDLTVSIEPVESRDKSISSNGEAWKNVVLGHKSEMIQYASVPKNSVFNIRSRRNGDRYTPVNGNQSKIKDLLITAHIPQQLKDAIPIIELENQIVWFSGWRIAQEFKIPDKAANTSTQKIAIRAKFN
ncbi:tRNA lysidine(34) synthetase TilS [bacterium]|nr:tRNA lysidine(34) synthetase TilS [bacterium]